MAKNIYMELETSKSNKYLCSSLKKYNPLNNKYFLNVLLSIKRAMKTNSISNSSCDSGFAHCSTVTLQVLWVLKSGN